MRVWGICPLILGKVFGLRWGYYRGGLCWRVGLGGNISIAEYAWIAGSVNYRLNTSMNNNNVSMVAELMNRNSREWNKELVINTFSDVDTARILRIQLAKECHDNLVVWCGEPFGVYGEFSGSTKTIQMRVVKAFTSSGKAAQWVPLFRAFIKINFDGAFDRCCFRSSSGVVARSVEGVVLVSSTVLHEDIGSAFAAEALACF
ncbi:hypothetical protein Goari_016704 [Gossypium aridum]|uniref:RNase H type-1 domain-containing protein n=1 Tax=Gossypium aridum TaxID=34290 RepID=A0A7J8WJI7_GOSAI|nr:hypothetical protein [Gossypium aridum]